MTNTLIDELRAAAKRNSLSLHNRELMAKAADALERKQGEWITEFEPDGTPYCLHCSVCDEDFHYIDITTAYDFCPHCGADMRTPGGDV